MITQNASSKVYFGGPKLAPCLLRDLLAERIMAVPAGGTIDWVTYYLRDRRLAEALVNARRRGVSVNVTLERQPRIAGANDAVIAMLAHADGLGPGLRTVQHQPIPTRPGVTRKPRLHTKVFCFSHPRPTALVGSFNPVCDQPENDPEVLRHIGDHDRGHNVLVELSDPGLVEGLVRHTRHLHGGKHGRLERFNVRNNVPLRGSGTEIYFWPRVRANPISLLLGRFGRGTRVRIAASHIKGPGAVRPLVELARRGAEVRILAASSPRRVPESTLGKLLDAGVSICRMPEPDGVPMHLKFLLIEDRDQHYCIFGSYNWTTRARWLNHEIAVISRDTQLFDAFGARWETLWSEHALQDRCSRADRMAANDYGSASTDQVSQRLKC